MKSGRLVHHISEVAKCPSFSSYEERLHPYIQNVFKEIPDSAEIKAPGNNLIFQIGNRSQDPLIGIACHIDKINHYGPEYPDELPVSVTDTYIEGAMDDSAGVGLALTLAEEAANHDWPNLLFFFSEMEESKGLKEHPELLKNNGEGYTHGMGAQRIADCCKKQSLIPEEIITLDTTPLFQGKKGIALYSKHWELNELNASQTLKEATRDVVNVLQAIHPDIELHNNTNDYLHYGYEFNAGRSGAVVSIALEPSIHPYHQKGERVFRDDMQKVLVIMKTYLNQKSS